jgi:hypothetical protein
MVKLERFLGLKLGYFAPTGANTPRFHSLLLNTADTSAFIPVGRFIILAHWFTHQAIILSFDIPKKCIPLTGAKHLRMSFV